MSSKDFFVAHGEKLALLVIAGLSGWSVYSTINNPEVRPKDVSDAVIDSYVNLIELKRETLLPPQLKMPSDYVAALRTRLDSSLPTSSYVAWLSTPPDVGPDSGSRPFYYYELLPPRVAATDQVGSVELTVTMPESVHQDGRLVDAGTKSWKAGLSENHAERAGLLIDYQIGNGPMKPLVAPGVVNGFMPLADPAAAEIKIPFQADSAWETYTIRIRLLVRATAFPLTDSKSTELKSQAVLVHPGRMTADADWSSLDASVRAGKADVIGRFLQPVAAPAGLTLRPGEQCFSSKDATCSVAVTSATRFAFLKGTEDADGITATVLVTRLMLPSGAALTAGQAQSSGKWLLQPEVFKVKAGEKIGGNRTVVDPRTKEARKIQVELSTPFSLVEVKKDIKRVLYYELVTKTRAGGQRDLDLKPKEKLTDVALFKSASSVGQSRAFARLLRIDKSKADARIYPDFPGLFYDEEAEFRKNPAGFQQRELEPTKPVWHDANETGGPLDEQRKRTSDDLFKTDTRYVEFPDGRVFFWEPVNKALREFIIPGSDADRATKRDAPAAAPAPAPAEATPPATTPAAPTVAPAPAK